jgi:hypothetical protein
MRALGIGLLIFNLLLTAAIGLYLAPASWGKRQEMNATVAKHYLVKSGLPVDGKFDSSASQQPITFTVAGGHVVSSVSTELLTGYFDGTNGGPVASQTEELDRAYNAKTSELNGLADGEAIRVLAGSFSQQGAFVPGLLSAMARSYDDRFAVRQLIPRGQGADVAGAAKKLKEQFAAHYNAAKQATNEIEKKGKIAHFLAFLEPDKDTWQKRVILVVGMVEYLKMLGEQSAATDDFARRVSRRIEQDQETFTQEYELLRKLAVERGQLRNLQSEVEKLVGQNQADDQTATNARTTQKSNRDAEVADWNKKVAEQLAANAALEKQLQEAQRKVAALLDEIADRELKLEAAEKSAGGK